MPLKLWAKILSHYTQAIIRKVREIHSNDSSAKINIVGHSLGAFEASIIYNIPGLLGSNDRVMMLGIPSNVPSEMLMQGAGEADASVYSAPNDWISNRGADSDSGIDLNNLRLQLGVPINIVETHNGNSGVTNKAHDRCRYQQSIYGSSYQC